jgi:hypothetical protein
VASSDRLINHDENERGWHVGEIIRGESRGFALIERLQERGESEPREPRVRSIIESPITKSKSNT